MEFVGNNSITKTMHKTTHSMSSHTWSNHPGSLAVFCTVCDKKLGRSLGTRLVFCITKNWKSSGVVLCHFESMGSLLHGHVAIITETESTHIVNESILQLGVVPSLLSLLRAVERSHTYVGNRTWYGLGTKLLRCPSSGRSKGGFHGTPPFTRKHCWSC